MVAPAVHGALAPDSRTLPALRRREREKSWQDEVRERVHRRKRRRTGDPELPLFDAAAEETAGPEQEADVLEPASAFASEALEEPPPAREARGAAFESRVLDRVDPLDSLEDLPLRTEASPPPAPLPEPRPAAGSLPDAFHEAAAGSEASPEEGWSVEGPLEPRLEPPPRQVEERPVERPAQPLERAQAAAVDVAILGALSFLVVYFTSRSAHVPIEGLRPSWPYLAGYLAFLALAYAVYFTGTTGQTLGKLIYGLRVVDTSGRPPGYLRTAGRAALGALGVALAGLGLLPVFFDPARRAFHDRVLRTRVVRG
jgi:uncharacterized RDD family membrane protein YckC